MSMPANPYEPPKEESRFAFYEKVRLRSPSPAKDHLNGKLCAVLGKVQNDQGQWYYTVHVYGEEHCICCYEHELEPTGEFDQRETFYSGESIRISQDGEVLD